MISSFIITGFLGVGKTTMLTNSVKKHFTDKKIAIVVNEFGDIGVDSKILKNVYSEVLEISEGCICCQLAEEFEKGVSEIIKNYDPEIIFVETSGASEPFPIFLSLQNLGISIDGIVCVVDSKNINSYIDNSTAKYQIGGSNIIILNKTDLVDDKILQDVKITVESIKDEFNIRNTMTNKAIFKNHVVYEAQQGLVNEEVFHGLYKVEDFIDFKKNDNIHLHHTHEDKIIQSIVYLDDNINFADLDEILDNLPSNIFRVKGVVKVNDVQNPIFVNYSFGDLSFEELNEYKEKSLLILIGTDIKKDVQDLCDANKIMNIKS